MVDSQLKLLTTIDDVLDALDGGSAAARLGGCSPQSISNAVARGRLPSATFVIFTDHLAERGFRALPELWGIKSRVSADPRLRGVTPDVERRRG